MEPTDGRVAGVGDFNGDGYSDVLLWSSTDQTGKLLFIRDGKVSGEIPWQPHKRSSWNVAGIGDFNDTGSSDILLRDTMGNLEIVSFTNNTTASHDFDVYSLFNSTTADFNKRWKTPANGAAGVLWHFLKITNDKRSRVLCPRYEPMAQQRLGAETCPKPELRSRFLVDSAKVRNTQSSWISRLDQFFKLVAFAVMLPGVNPS
jgi:hypothetical protein